MGRTCRGIVLFIILTVVYHSNLRAIPALDSLPGALLPFSILLDGTLALDRFGPYLEQNIASSQLIVYRSGGHWYSAYPIAGPVIATILYVPLLLIPGLAQQPPESLVAVARIYEKLTAVAFTAAAGVAMLQLLRRFTSERIRGY